MNTCKTAERGSCAAVPPDLLSLLLEGAPDKLLVYVASPFAGDVERNIMKARRYCRFVVDNGAIPLAPHLLLPQFMSDTTERDAAMLMNDVFLSKCDQLWMFGNTITDGMTREWVRAVQLEMPIRYFTDDCTERPQGYASRR